MPRKKTKTENEQTWTKRKWTRSKDKAKDRLNVNVLTEHGGTTRANDREFIGLTGHRFDGSSKTKTLIGSRRSKRRAKNAQAKQARKANRAR